MQLSVIIDPCVSGFSAENLLEHVAFTSYLTIINETSQVFLQPIEPDHFFSHRTEVRFGSLSFRVMGEGWEPNDIAELFQLRHFRDQYFNPLLQGEEFQGEEFQGEEFQGEEFTVAPRILEEISAALNELRALSTGIDEIPRSIEDASPEYIHFWKRASELVDFVSDFIDFRKRSAYGKAIVDKLLSYINRQEA